MKRFWIVAGALVVTIGTLSVALLLGAAGFDVRRYTQHEGRLQRVMREQPTVERLTQAFQEEGTAQLAAPEGRAESEKVIAAHGGARQKELRAKALQYPQMRLYRSGDMLYFVFFDASGVMRDFTCVSA